MSTTDNNYVEYDRDLMRSCIYGLAIGDAPGVPYEFCARGKAVIGQCIQEGDRR